MSPLSANICETLTPLEVREPAFIRRGVTSALRVNKALRSVGARWLT